MCMGSELLCAVYNVVTILSMADMVRLACMQKHMSSAGSVWYVGVYVMLWNFITAEHGLMEDCKVSNVKYLVHMNRLSACREFFDVHSWQNGTRYVYAYFWGMLIFEACLWWGATNTCIKTWYNILMFTTFDRYSQHAIDRSLPTPTHQHKLDETNKSLIVFFC